MIVDKKKKITENNITKLSHCVPGLLGGWEHVSVFPDEVLALIARTEAGAASQSQVPLLKEAVHVEEDHLVLGGFGCLEKLPGRGRVCSPVGGN